MIKLLYKLFNHDKIDELQKTIDIYKERNAQLEKEVKEYKGYKLKYEVTKLYVEDDEALLELLDAANKAEEREADNINRARYHRQIGLVNAAAQQQAALARAQFGRVGGIGGIGTPFSIY